MATATIKNEEVTHLIIGAGYWGKGRSLADAKSAFRAAGGLLGSGYTVVYFGEGSTFAGIDGMGGYYWAADSAAPAAYDVQPRRVRK